MKPSLGWAIGVAGMLALVSCADSPAMLESPEMLASAGGADRPFAGSCRLVLAARIHDDEEEGSSGGCGGGDEGDPEGGPPIARHYEIRGSCQLTHLGRADVVGRLNLTGPLGGGHAAESGHGGALAARGRLAFVAANGDQLAGRYLPVTAQFTPALDGDGGIVAFTTTQRIGESCSGHASILPGASVALDEHDDEPVNSGRFVAALGEATLLGDVRIRRSTRGGSGTLTILGGRLSY